MSDNKVTMVDNPMKDGKNIELTNANNDDDDDGIFDEDVVTVDEDTLGEEINIEKKKSLKHTMTMGGHDGMPISCSNLSNL